MEYFVARTFYDLLRCVVIKSDSDLCIEIKDNENTMQKEDLKTINLETFKLVFNEKLIK